MKKMIASVLLLTVGILLRAGSVPAGWSTDFAGAKQKAAKEKTPMLVLFTGSDWCRYCVMLHDRVLTKPEFRKFAADKKISLIYLDFPSRIQQPEELKKQNRKLRTECGVNGFPTTLLFDSDGRELGRIAGFSPQYISKLSDMLEKEKK